MNQTFSQAIAKVYQISKGGCFALHRPEDDKIWLERGLDVSVLRSNLGHHTETEIDGYQIKCRHCDDVWNLYVWEKKS